MRIFGTIIGVGLVFGLVGCSGSQPAPAIPGYTLKVNAPTPAVKTSGGHSAAMSATLGPGAGSNPFGSKVSGN
jgi:hypothetical protein